MARMTKAEIQDKLRQIKVEFPADTKYNDLWKLWKANKPEMLVDKKPTQIMAEIHEATGFSIELISIAREAGFDYPQIRNYPDAAGLKAAVIRAKPGTALKFRKAAARPVHKEVVMVDDVLEFDTSCRAGISSPMKMAEKEERQIQSHISRGRINRRNIDTTTIVRQGKADSHNNTVSHVTVKYRRIE